MKLALKQECWMKIFNC